jgi:hypothetical protein
MVMVLDFAEQESRSLVVFLGEYDENITEDEVLRRITCYRDKLERPVEQ